ncbi:Integral membrane protein [Streptomyces albidoflavus]|uniref:PepSY-associated TM helix domain-containing protein n=1 Tax=Streptomyces TaxID=1883 RepID=UPI0001AEE6B0|nr:PepSY domain-containing protein [Streptomyces albidoflavus]BDH49197.1 peptidase [Streptomyces albus]AGI86602.1 Integral membrane protein [Streptomyces albidoflavus]QLP90373.1 Integral membrane protein [Streptomyces albidoflavus]WAE08887.1 Integral membrane protein [Streptomyces albidoflavus]WAE14528.1 Integral membrane protein [Streptomyces albidoflavus]
MTDITGVPDAASAPPQGGPPPREPNDARRPGAWAALRPLALRLHFFAGLLVAPLLLVTAMSGLLYALSVQAEKIVYHDELTVSVPAQGERLPLDQQVDAARAERPELDVTAVWTPADADGTTRVIFADPSLGASKSQAVFVDPYTAEVSGELVQYGSSGALPLRTWLSEFHRHLHLGEPGRLYSELAASWLWAVVLGGVLLWIGRRRARPGARGLLLLRRGAPQGRSRTVNRHAVLGVWAAVGLVLISATGLTWSTYAGARIGAVQDRLGGATPVLSAELTPGGGTGDAHDGHEGHEGHEGHAGPAKDGAEAADIGLDAAVAAAAARGVDEAVIVTLPTEGRGYQVAEGDKQVPVHLDAVAVDPRNGEVLSEVRFAEYPLLAKLTRLGIDAHMGLLFGLPNQLALAALMAAVLLLLVWGYRMWWQRRPAGRAVGKPMPRGSLRALPARLLVPLVAVTLLVGWFLPLLGISLSVFLVADTLVGLWSRRRAAGRAPAG